MIPITWPQRVITTPFQYVAGESYSEKVLDTSPVAYWPLNETSGGSAIDQIDSPSQDGTYNGVSLNADTGPDGQPVGLWDGTSNDIQLPGPTLDTPFDSSAGSMACWVKLPSAALTDGVLRRAVSIGVDNNNRIQLSKSNTNNRISFFHRAGATVDSINFNSFSSTDWAHLIGTWDTGADIIEFFVNNVSAGTAGTLGVWAGTLTNTYTAIGSANATNYWSGNIAHVLLYNKVLSSAERAIIATI